jgi:transposase-like protein
VLHDLKISNRHERGRWRNNRAENSHQPTRRRERKMQGVGQTGAGKSTLLLNLLRQDFENGADVAFA